MGLHANGTPTDFHKAIEELKAISPEPAIVSNDPVMITLMNSPRTVTILVSPR